MKSRRGLEVSIDSDQVLAAWDDFFDRLLRIAPGAEEILDVAKSNPQEPVLQLAVAMFWLFGQTPEAQKEANKALRELENLPEGTLNAREELWKKSLRRWHDREFDLAATALEELTKTWPEDLPAAKAAEFLYYVLGQQHSGPRFRQHLDRLRPWHSQDADFLAMEAFAHELCGSMDEAKKSAESALIVAERNPWAQHALAHVLLWEGNSEAALNQMDRWVGDWEASARPIHSHNAWHLALARLDRLELSQAWSVFDQHVWRKTPTVVVEQLDSIAFLWRAELAGVEVSTDRWQTLVPEIVAASQTLFMPFATAHYAYALARAAEKEALDDLLMRTNQRAGALDAEARRVWAPTGETVVRAAAALGSGEAALAAESFTASLPRLTEIGGSDAQDDLFRFAHIESLKRAGRHSEACTVLKGRLAQKTASPLEESLLAGLGD